MQLHEKSKKPGEMQLVPDRRAQSDAEEVLGRYREHAPIVLAAHGSVGIETIQRAHKRGYGADAARILAEAPSFQEGIRKLVQHRRAQRPKHVLHR